MHVEVPKAKKWKEFSSEYLMIVVSIVTALGLEHAVTSYHHRHLAHEAVDRIEAELRFNQKEIETALEHNQALQKRVDKLTQAFVEDLKRGTPDQAAIQRLIERDPKSLDLAVMSPTLRHEAWDVAVANQAASWIEPDKLERYAALYAHMRDIAAIETGGGNRFFDGPQMITVFADIQLGKAQVRDVLGVLKQMSSAYGSMDGNLEELQRDFAKRAGGEAAHVAQR